MRGKTWGAALLTAAATNKCGPKALRRYFSRLQTAHSFPTFLPRNTRSYSTWNDCSSMRDNGPNGWCWDSESHVKNTTLYLKSSGLFALGYNRM